MTYIVEYCTFVLSVGDGLQAIQLEDGTTAYISQSTAATVFNDGSALETSSLSLENLQTQVYLPPATKLGQGYVFTGVCDSVCHAMMTKGMVFRYTWVYSKEDTMAHTRRLVVIS